MKTLSPKIFVSVILFAALACGTKSQKHEGHDMDDKASTMENANQALYDQVMDIHDEVMPKTESLYNLNKGLKAKLKESKSDEEKLQLQSRITYLDSVNNMMMDWMHGFRPPADSVDTETARAYYETQLDRVKIVKEAILVALEKEK